VKYFKKITSYSFLLASVLLLLSSCSTKPSIDLLVKNGHIQTVDSLMQEFSCMAIRDGKIVALGGNELKEKYRSDSVFDVGGAFIYPGFIDAHAHFYGLGLTTQRVDLVGTRSWEEVLERCKIFVETHHPQTLTGRGWDQNDWEVKTYPDNAALNRLFPDIPVLLKRVDGHAAIANEQALQLSGITPQSVIDGGEILTVNGKLTGVLIDNAVDEVQSKLPQPSVSERTTALLQAQALCFATGLTSVCDAGLESEIIEQIDSLQQAGILQMRIDAMVSISDKNLDTWLARAPIQTDHLRVASFKMYADGALGSRGACLLEPYLDQPGHQGFLLTPPAIIHEYIKRVAASDYQLNTHCIGDSANRFLLHAYGKALGLKSNRRWRIEHAQVLNPGDFPLFNAYGIIPSVQPTHATSDMYWAGDRIGKERLKGAYAYKLLMDQHGWIPLGTDFPVEEVNPLYTFYSAIARKDATGFPENGFQPQHALSREQALSGITIWAAKASFEENKKGSLEAGKLADFVVMKENLLSENLEVIRNAKIEGVYLGGKRVY
jgi:hypothetical protein